MASATFFHCCLIYIFGLLLVVHGSPEKPEPGEEQQTTEYYFYDDELPKQGEGQGDNNDNVTEQQKTSQEVEDVKEQEEKYQEHEGDADRKHDNSMEKPILVTEFGTQNWKFAANLFKEARKKEDGNLVFSPLSLTTAMVMLNAGAGGQTATEIQTLLKFGTNSELAIQNQTRVINSLKNQGVKKTGLENLVFPPLNMTSLMARLNEAVEGERAQEIQKLLERARQSGDLIPDPQAIINLVKEETAAQAGESGVTLETASRIFANIKNAKLLSNYVRAVSSLGEVETLDFSEPTKVVARMNEWVKTQTQGKISKIAGEKDFSKETAAVLLDTLYFKAPWKQPFNKTLTEKADFHVSENKTVQVEMMYISAEFPYADLDKAQASAVFLPYQGDRLSMIIYLPWKESNLSTLEEKLETLVPTEVRNKATKTEISLHLPKFNMSSSLDFKEILTSLGVERMFNRTEADFSKMSESSEFHVSKLVQQVFIEVNEEGTEAAVLTEAHGLAATSTQPEFRVNRPFIFQIFDNVTRTILLTGQVTNPNGNPAPIPISAPTSAPSKDSHETTKMLPNSSTSAPVANKYTVEPISSTQTTTPAPSTHNFPPTSSISTAFNSTSFPAEEITTKKNNITPAAPHSSTQITTPAPSTHNFAPNSSISNSTLTVQEIPTNENATSTIQPNSSTGNTTEKPKEKGSGAQNSNNCMAPLLMICVSWLIMW